MNSKSKTCEFCGKVFEYPVEQQVRKYCTHDCRAKANRAAYKSRGTIEIKETCFVCGAEFIKTNRNASKRYCSRGCAKLAIKARERTKKLKNITIPIRCVKECDIIREFNTERDFYNFVIRYYYLFGIDEILRYDEHTLPDLIVSISGKRIRLELELFDVNFTKHGHDKSLVDLVFCVYSFGKLQGIPVAYLFKTKGTPEDFKIIGENSVFNLGKWL